MSKPWLPENAISIFDARTEIGEQFPQLQPISIENFGAGWDNSAFLVNQKYIFRFPRRAIAVPWLETEIKLLPQLTRLLPLEIPQPLFIGKPGARFSWPFAGYKMLSGKTAETAVLSMTQRKQNVSILAGFLRALHNIPLEDLSEFAAKEDDIQRLDLSVQVPKTLKMLQTIKEKQYHPDVSKFTNYLKKLKLNQPKFKPCLLHGDLYAKHLLVNQDLKICGVIDWGDMHIGNIALDLEVVHDFLPIECHEDFRRQYGEIPNDIWELSFVRAIYAASLLMIYAHDVKDAALLAETDVSFQLLSQNSLLAV